MKDGAESHEAKEIIPVSLAPTIIENFSDEEDSGRLLFKAVYGKMNSLTFNFSFFVFISSPGFGRLLLFLLLSLIFFSSLQSLIVPSSSHRFHLTICIFIMIGNALTVTTFLLATTFLSAQVISIGPNTVSELDLNAYSGR
jgi:hypothetical protein